ncbi:MAG: ROK family transcriptional regulator [Treponema sp.]|nr:ROK family transcriptional regulator [Treponema sp.]
MKSQNLFAEEKTLKVLRLIWSKKRISRVEIANILGWDKSTVTKLVTELKEIGILTESAQGTSGPLGGRRPVYLEITADYACVGGIEVNPEGVVYCLMNLQGQMIYYNNEEITYDYNGEQKIGNLFAKACKTLEKKAEEENLQLIGIGLGLPALLNSTKGEITYSLPLMIEKPVYINEILSNVTDLPVLIENDARCCCYSEIINGMQGRSNIDVTNMIFVLTEYRAYTPVANSKKNLAVGLGIVLNSQLLKGPDDSAGEFRSMLWEEGNEGQFYAGEEKLSDVISDSEELHYVFYELAQHIAFLVNTLNLTTVCIGGISREYISILENYINERIKIQWSYKNERKIVVKMASFGEYAVAHGAAAMFLTKVFSKPVESEALKTSVSILDLL